MRSYIKVFTIIAFTVATTFIIGPFKNGILLFGDTDLTYHFAGKFFSFDKIYLWNDYFQSGIMDFNKFQGFFLKKLIYLVNLVVSDLYLFSYLWYFLPVIFFILTLYLLLKEFAKFDKARRSAKLSISAMAVSLLSVFSGIFALYVVGQVLVVLSLVLVNLFLIFFAKNLLHLTKYNRNNYRYLVIAAVFISESTIYLQNIILLGYVALFLLIFNYRYVIYRYRAFLKQLLVMGGITLLLNASWLSVVFYQFVGNDKTSSELINYDTDMGWEIAESISGNIYMHELLRLKSYHVFNNTPFLFEIVTLIPIFIILVYMARKKFHSNRLESNLLLLLPFSIIISFGIHHTTKYIYKFLWEFVPLFNTFRTVMKFSFVFLYVFSLLLFLCLMKTQVKKYWILSIAGLSLTIIFSGSYYLQPEFKRNMTQYSIPDYYYKIASYDLGEHNSKLGNNMILPQINWQTQYTWAPDKIDSMNIFPFFYGAGNLINGAQYESNPQFEYNILFDFAMKEGDIDYIKEVASLGNIKYITYQEDIRFPRDDTRTARFNYKQIEAAERIGEKLKNAELCSGVSTFGKIKLCDLSDEIFSPLFRTSIPLKQVSIKNQAHLDMSLEAPRIALSLEIMKVFPEGFSKTLDRVNSKEKEFPAEVYASMAPHVSQECFENGLPCNIYFVDDLPNGDYEIYFHHAERRETDPENYNVIDEDINKYYDLEIYKNIETSYIDRSIKNAPRGIKTEVPEIYSSMNTIRYFAAKDQYFVGNTNIEQGSVAIRTSNNNFFTFGRFYFVKKSDNFDQVATISFNPPTIEFRKINPTKYRVVVHAAEDNFDLTMGNTFNSDWHIFADKASDLNPNSIDLEEYVILEKDNKDQASQKKLKDMLDSNLISSLGLGKRIDFISNNIKNTIQNNNLEQGPFYETWFKKPAAPKSHGNSIVKDYGNSWNIDPAKICADLPESCSANEDGSKNLYFIVEFRTQKVFLIGLCISILSFLVVVYYLIQIRVKKIRLEKKYER